jgi:catechol 2,3-dioxygenase-like lactoylglutathione lyase family enzyme
MGNDAKSGTAHGGFHHLTLNVQDIDRSEKWYGEVLGFEPAARYENEAFARVILRHPDSGAVLGLNRHNAALAAEPFDERRAGLDHFALRAADHAALVAWVDRFDEFGIPHSDIKSGSAPGSFLVTFRDPDGLQLEVFVPGA